MERFAFGGIPAGQSAAAGQAHGKAVHAVAIGSPSGARAEILTLGAILRSLTIPLAAAGAQDVVLGFDAVDAYVRDASYMGVVVGRYANRIAHGRFAHNRKTFNLDRNENAATTLHGGSGGFSTRLWTIEELSPDGITLGLISPDGDQGFPGTLTARCRYWFSGASELSFAFSATTDAATPVNLTSHAYFNLDSSGNLDAHRLRIAADHYTPTGPDLIPTGEIAPVAGTPFDFTEFRTLAQPQPAYDVNFALHGAAGDMREAAVLQSSRSGLAMALHTTKPGLQFYGGHLLAPADAGKSGRRYGPHAGLCLEPQFFPDSPNQPRFPSSILLPGEPYSHTTLLRFFEQD